MQASRVEPREQLDRKVNESRAAFLLGLSTEDLRRLSAKTGLGERDAESGDHLFTYAELYRLCRLAAEEAGLSAAEQHAL